MPNPSHDTASPTLTLAAIIVASAALLAFILPSPAASHTEPLSRAALLVDINSADFHTLQLLPEIGPTLAHRIIDDRPYSRPDDLQRVRGIGPITAAQLAPHITFGPQPTP